MSDGFSASIKMTVSFLTFILLMWWITFFDSDFEPFLHPRDKSYLGLVHDPFHVFMHLVC